MVIDGLLASLRPPDREPPRLASLSAGQEAVVVAVLDVLAFAGVAASRLRPAGAGGVLGPNALYRRRPPEEGG